MAEINYRAKKRYGQNFLIDKNILAKIIASAQLSDQDTVLEIGMGKGILTEALAKKSKKVITIEIDQDLFPKIKQKLNGYENISFVMGDFLKKSEDIFSQINDKVKIIANIPYYITTPIIEKLFGYLDKINLIVLMVQKEVAERINAQPGNKIYGSLTLYVNYYCQVKKLFNVSPNSFFPRPKVFSSVISLTPLIKKNNLDINSEKKLFNIIHAAFWGRRKTIANCLKTSPYISLSAADINTLKEKTGLDLRRRGETFSLEEFILLAKAIDLPVVV